jgi:CRP-like cAMP-binding protein
VRPVDRGEILFKPNETDIPFFVLLSGGMEIVQPDLDGGERTSPPMAPAISPAK